MNDIENDVPFLDSPNSCQTSVSRSQASRDHLDNDPQDNGSDPEEEIDAGGANNSSHTSRCDRFEE